MYPEIRLRRNRKKKWLIDLLAETKLTADDLILPLFVVEGENIKQEIDSLPGIHRYSIDQLVEICREAHSKSINVVALFPCLDLSLKSDDASEAFNLDNLMCRAIRAIKSANINIGIICDIALDPYTSHGHDGIMINDEVDNDETIKALSKQAVTLAKAGADIVAPSDMMDGRVGYIRAELDEAGFANVNIMSYSVKYNSAFYGPFRAAIGSSIEGYLDKSSYQVDYRNINDSLREIEQDIFEGADMVIIKPALAYLDLIKAASQEFNINIIAYQVSGEYAMLKFAAINGALNWEKALIESLTSMKRAGARAIFTYAALEVVDIINRLGKHNG